MRQGNTFSHLIIALAVSLVYFGTGPGLTAAQNSQEKQEKKKARKIWTNDDFPSGRTAPRTRAEKVSPKLASSPLPPKDAAVFLKLTPKERQQLIAVYEADIQGTEESIAELRRHLYRGSDRAQRKRYRDELRRLEQLLVKSRQELELLRSLSQPKPEKKNSETPPSPTSGRETGS